MRKHLPTFFRSATALSLVSILLVFATISYAEDHVFYSLQLASFRYLDNANRQVNQLKEGEKHVFWEKVDIPGKGVFYRVFLGRFNSPEAAVEYWKQLEEQGVVTDLIVRRFVETVPKQSITKPKPVTVTKSTEAPEKRFLDNRNGTVTDLKTGLMWARNGWRTEFFAATDWWTARHNISAFRLAGFDDWRLPTIEEWKALIDPTKEYPALVEPNPFVNIITHMPYWSASEYSYTPQVDCASDCPGHVYTVMLYSGNIQRINKKETGFVLPVRDVRTP